MSFAWILLVSAATGFIALSYEILWYRAYSFASWSSPMAFGVLLGAYLAGVGYGSLRARAFCQRHPATGDPRQLLALCGFFTLANLLSFLVIPGLARLCGFHWFPSLLLVFLATGFLGAVLPLLSHFGIRPDRRAGANLSYVYLANILGAAAGSLLTGFVLTDHMGLRGIGLLQAELSVLLVAVLLLRCQLPRARLVALQLALGGLGLLLGALATPLFAGVYERMLFKWRYEGQRFAQVVENRSGVITVDRAGTIYGGGAYDGRFNTSLARDNNGIVRAYLSVALHPAPREVLMIGLGGGAWAQVVANHPALEKLTVLEINPGYLQVIPRHPEVRSLLHNPRVEVVIDDGRRWLLRHPERSFDAIVMNSTWHFRSLATNLLSREFLELLRGRLRPGGMALYNTTFSPDVQRTGAEAFPYALYIVNALLVSNAPLPVDRERLRALLLSWRIDGKPVLDPGQKADLEALDKTLRTVASAPGRDKILAFSRHGTIVTDDNMRPEWHGTDVPEEVAPFGFLAPLLRD